MLAHKPTVILDDGSSATLSTLLGKRCDQGLAKREYSSPDELAKEISWCDKAMNWFNRDDPAKDVSFKSCPTGAEKIKWTERLTRAGAKAVAYHLSLNWIREAAELESSPELRKSIRRQYIKTYIANYRPVLSFRLATKLIWLDGKNASHEGKRAADHGRNYGAVPHYEYHLIDIYEGFGELLKAKAIVPLDMVQALRDFFTDENLTVLDKLFLEEEAYVYNLLK